MAWNSVNKAPLLSFIVLLLYSLSHLKLNTFLHSLNQDYPVVKVSLWYVPLTFHEQVVSYNKQKASMRPETKILIGNGILPFGSLALIYNLLSGRRRLCGLSALFVLLGLDLSASAEIKGDMREIWVALCLTLKSSFGSLPL